MESASQIGMYPWKAVAAAPELGAGPRPNAIRFLADSKALRWLTMAIPPSVERQFFSRSGDWSGACT
jgi:hypothetical protein